MDSINRILSRLSREIIRKNEYLSLVVGSKNLPWVAILAYAYDHDWNLYFASMPDSKHGRALTQDSKVLCTIFDSHQDWGKGVGLQIQANCKIVPQKELKTVISVYFNRKYPYGKVEPEGKKFFINELKNTSGKYKFYKITPKNVWINNPYSKEDKRVRVDLKN